MTRWAVKAPHDGKEHPIADRVLIECRHVVSTYTKVGGGSSPSDLIVENGAISKYHLAATLNRRRDEV